MNNFPDTLKILIISDDYKPIAGIAIMIRLFSNHKNDYFFIPNLSDLDGVIEIEKEWLKKRIDEMRNLFIMDYASTLDDCQSKIEIKVMDKNDVINAIEVKKLYFDIVNVSEKEIENLQNSINDSYLPVSKTFEISKQKVMEIELIVSRLKS